MIKIEEDMMGGACGTSGGKMIWWVNLKKNRLSA
jgi:hypothetical protein